jgi:hypothetical protein
MLGQHVILGILIVVGFITLGFAAHAQFASKSALDEASILILDASKQVQAVAARQAILQLQLQTLIEITQVVQERGVECSRNIENLNTLVSQGIIDND